MTTAELGTSGIVLGAVDELGVQWRNESGLWGSSPGVRALTGERETDHGSWDASRFYGPRTWPIAGLVTAPDHTTLHQARVRLEAALSVRPFRIRGIEPGFDRVATFRRDSDVEWTEITSRGLARFSASLYGADPRLYSAAVQTVSMGFPATSGGREWPATWPGAWTATVVNGEAALVNEGSETAWPVWRIDGPVSQPQIVNTATGESMNFDLELAAGEWLTVDTATHRVLGNGDVQASRRSAFWGTWWGLAPQTVTPVVARFAGASAGSGAQLQASWQHTWI